MRRRGTPLHFPAVIRVQWWFSSQYPFFLSVLPRPSQNNFFVVVDLLLRTLYLFAALRILRLADADPIPLLALSGRQ